MSDTITNDINQELVALQADLRENLKAELNRETAVTDLEKRTHEMQVESKGYESEAQKLKLKMQWWYWALIGGVCVVGFLLVWFFFFK